MIVESKKPADDNSENKKDKDNKDLRKNSNSFNNNNNVNKKVNKETPEYNEYNNSNFTDLNKTKNNIDKTKTVNITSLNTTSNTKKSTQVTFTNLKPLALTPKGIYNPSVYCFMNTFMQCLVSIPEINNYFLSQQYSILNTRTNYQTCDALNEFIEYYKDSRKSFKPPSSLYTVCHSFLTPNRQHDCQEFMRRFLGKIQDEINGKPKYSFDKVKNVNQAWNIYIEKNMSIIDQAFAGMFKSSVICKKCKYNSGKFNNNLTF